MKRIISLVLCFCMCLSLMSGFGFTFAADPTLSGTAYQDLFDADSAVYADTMIVFPGKTFTAGEKLTFSFSGVTVEETYNAARHFSSYANALAAWETKYTGTQLVTKVPNFVLTAGTYNETITVRFNANIYGAQAGITPNDPDFDVKKALPTTDWAANTARPGNVGETVLAGGILRSNVGPDSEKSKYYDIRVSAGVNTQTLNIDGVKLTATSAITIADYKQSAKDATSTINVKSSIFDGNAHGFDGAQDGANQSENFNDYNVTDCRVLNQTGDFIYRYQRKVVIDDTAFSNINALYTGGNVGKTNAAKYEFGAGSNYLYWNSLGGERGVSYEIKNSRIANSTAYEFLKISDHTYYPSVSAKFDSNIFYNVGTSQWGMVMFYVYKQDGKLYPTPEISFTNNVIYSSTQKSNLLSSGTEYVDGPVNVTVTGNRIIGYDTATFNINTDTMASVMSGSVLNFDNNYYCKTANFTGTSDYNGVPFDTYNADWIRTNWNKFITVGNVPYFFDYAMTLSSADLQITGASFDKEEGYYVSQGDKTISAIIPENTTWSDISFTTNAPSGSTVKLYSDTAHTQEVSSVSFNDANATGSKTYYAVLNYKGIKIVYNVIIVAAQEAIDFKTEWTEDAVKKTAALLTKTASANGAVVRAFWQGQFYSFTYGVNAFATVAEAKAKGITQMILPAGEYGAIDIPGSIELYGEDYKVNPNKKYAEPETPWTLAEAWKDVNTVVAGDITVTAAATPSTSAGTTIYISGIEMRTDFVDNKRSASGYATKITFENTYVTASSSFGYIFKLSNANARSTDTATENKDEFLFKNGRINYTLDRMAQNEVPAYFAFEGSFFDQDFNMLGYSQWYPHVKKGEMRLEGNFFYRYKGNHATIGYFEGHSNNVDCVASGANTKLTLKDNILVDCFDNRTNDSATNPYSTNINAVGSYYGFYALGNAYKTTEMSGNTFINTKGPGILSFSILFSSGAKYNFNNVDLSERITISDNKFVGMYPMININDQTKTVKGDNNFYALYTPDYKTLTNGQAMMGVLEGKDYAVDYNLSAKASEFELITNREASMVSHTNREASIIIGKDEIYTSTLTTKDNALRYVIYTDEDCTNSVTHITAKDVGDGRMYYAKATKGTASVVYKLYVTVGNVNAKAPDTVGAKNIASPYLFYLKTAEMPHGTKFTMTWEGTEYMFTKGVNAFPSVSQITASHEGSTTPNVIMPSGTYTDDIIITKTVNIYGEGATEIKNNFNTTSPVKIACVGDSTTYGSGASDRLTGSWPAHLQSILNDTYGEGMYNVKNCGWGGSTINLISNSEYASDKYTFWTYTLTAQYFQALDMNPDIVMIKLGYNDTALLRYTSPAIYKARYQELIDTFQDLPSHPEVVIVGSIAGTGSKGGIRYDLMTETIIPAQKELAKENGLRYVDTWSAIQHLAGNSTYFKDNIHSTSEGYKLIAQNVADSVADLFTTGRQVTVDNVKVNTLIPSKLDKVKVACIGDSFTYGDKGHGGYPLYLQNFIGDGYEVRSYGEDGATLIDSKDGTLKGSSTTYCYDTTERGKASFEWDPDVVIITLGTNDCGGHMTDYHNLSWTLDSNGNTVTKYAESSTAAQEYLRDYAKLIAQYRSQGATRVIVSTNPRNNSLTHLIKKVADDNNCEFMDTYSTSSKWGNEYMNLVNLNGTGDGHFNDAGYEKYGKLVAELAFGDFATWYYDNQEEITNNAVIVDQSATAGTGKVTYNWEGRAYNFTWGVNAFTDINTAIAYAKTNNWKKLQVLIPENKIQTGGTAFTISTDPTGLESIEVYGQNRKFDPNDKSASSTDPTADWSLSKKWDSYSTNGGTSAVGTITYSLAKGFGGELKFKGVTMRSNYVNTARTSGNMDQTFENCRVDFTTTSNVHLFFTESTWTRTGAMNETTLVKNFRVDGFKSTQRLVQQATSNNLFWHGVYIKQQSGKTGTCYQLASNKAQKARVEIIGCNFRDGANMFSIAPAQNIQKVYSVLVMKDNVYYNVAAINTIFPYFLNEVTVEGNYYVLPNITSAFTYASKFDGKEITTGDFAEIIKYTAKNNTFILPNTSYASNFDINNETKVDISGTYIAVYDANYANGIKGVKPDLGGVAKCDYYYLDFARTVKNTDLAIQSLGLADEVENLVISDGSITAKSDCGKVITDLSAVTGNEKVSVKFYKDSALTQEVTELEMGITSASETYYIKSSYGLESKVYTLTFTLSDPKDFTEYVDDSGEIDASKAIALIPSCSTLANGTEIAAQWQGAVYKFVKGTNAFATIADIKTKFGTTTALQIVMPAGTYTAQLDIHGPWKFYGENFKTNPNVINADSASLSTAWGKFGNTILDNKNVVVAATASGDIAVKGLNLSRSISDTNRPVSDKKTTITFENIVYERKYLTGSAQEFNLQNANATNKDATAVNLDEVLIKNFHYINTNKSTAQAIFTEVMGRSLTIDGWCSPDNTPCFGYPEPGAGAQTANITLKNSFFKNLVGSTTYRKFIVCFAGHDEVLSYDQRKNREFVLNIENNTFVDCSLKSYTEGVIQIYPGAYSDINITGNTVVNTGATADYSFITWQGDGYRPNTGDMTDKITYEKNKFIGIMPKLKTVNANTSIASDGNYFAKYTTDFAEVAGGDTPADANADVYLDFACTTKKSQLVPSSSNIYGIKEAGKTRTLYGYATADITEFNFSGIGNYAVYTDENCNNAATSINVETGKATKVYVKATKDNICVVYTLYVMGVKSFADVENAQKSTMTAYYPSLYGASNGIKAVTYYNGAPYYFVKGENLATSPAEITFTTNDVLLPDDITSFDETLMKCTKLVSAKIDDIKYSVRKSKLGTIGDSITEGYSADDIASQGYSAIIGKTLGTESFAVTNYGRTTTTAMYIASRVSDNKERQYRVYDSTSKARYEASLKADLDIITFALGTNDSSSSSRWLENEVFIKDYIDLINEYKALDTKPQIIILTSLKRGDSASGNSIVENNTIHLQKYIAEKTGAILIDTYTEMAPYLDGTTTYFKDALHPTTAGHKIMGEFVAGEIVKYVGSKTPTAHADTYAITDTTHQLVCENCGVTGEVENHEFEYACSTTCSVCDFERVTTHTHVTKFDNDGHWGECECGDTTTKTEHTYTDALDEQCNGCDFVRAIGHTLVDKFDDKQHWKECTDEGCGEKFYVEDHEFDDIYDTTCNGCEYTFEIPAFSTFDDPHDMIDTSKAVLLSGEDRLVNAANGATVALTWCGKVYNFVKGTNAFTSLADAEKSGSNPHILVKNNTEGSNFYLAVPASVFTQNYAVNPVKVGTKIDGSDWAFNTEFDTTAGVDVVYEQIGLYNRNTNKNWDNPNGDYNFYGFTITKSVYDYSGFATNVTFQNLRFNPSDWANNYMMTFGNKNAGTSVGGDYSKTIFKNVYVSMGSGNTAGRFFANGTALSETFMIDGMFIDIPEDKAYETGELYFAFLEGWDSSFTVQNCCFRNYSYAYFHQSKRLASGESSITKWHNNIFYNSEFNSQWTSVVGLMFDMDSEFYFTDNKITHKDGTYPVASAAGAYSSITTPLKFVMTGNYVNYVRTFTLDYRKRPLSSDSIVMDNYFGSVKDNLATGKQLAFRVGASDMMYAKTWLINADGSNTSSMIQPMTFDGKDFTKTFTYNVGATQKTLNVSALINKGLNKSVAGFRDSECSTALDLTNVAVAAAGTKVYVEVVSPDGLTTEVYEVVITKDAEFSITNEGNGSTLDRNDNGTNYYWVGWRGEVSSAIAMQGEAEHRVGSIYMSDTTNLEAVKAAIKAGMADKKDINDIESVVTSVNAQYKTANPANTIRAYTMSENQVLTWNNQEQSYGFRYNFNIKENFYRGVVMYVVYTDVYGDIQVDFSELIVQQSGK